MSKILLPKTDIELRTPPSVGRAASVRSGLFCPWMDFSKFLNGGPPLVSFPVFNIDYNQQKITLKTFESGLNIAVFAPPDEIPTNPDAEETISFENTVIEVQEASSFDLAIGIVELVGPETIEVVCGIYPTGASGGEVRDMVSGAPLAAPFTLENGYKYGFSLDLSNNTAIGYDNDQLTVPVPLTVWGGFNKNNPHYFSHTVASFPANEFVLSPNTGSRPWDFSQSSGRYCRIPLPPPPPVGFCTPVDLNLFFFDQDLVLSGPNNLTIEATSTGAAMPQGGAYATQEFLATTQEVKIEAQIVKDTVSAGQQSFFGLVFAQGLPGGGPGGPDIFVGAYYSGKLDLGGGAGVLFDAVAGVPVLQGIGDISDYALAVYIDPTGSASFKDNQGNSGALTLDASFVSFSEVQMAAFVSAGAILGQELDITCNFGSSEFITGNDATKWCDNPLPPLCAPVNLFINAGIPPNTQDIVLSGPNNLTVTATSLGNDASESGVAALEFFNTQTQPVKIETTITTIPLQASVIPSIAIGFFHDIFTTPQAITILSYFPTLSNGTLGDAVGNILDTFMIFEDPTTLAISIDPTPQNKVYAFSVNSGVAGSVNVHGVVTNVTGFELQEDIAANIIANGFTDPTIQSLTIDPSDNRVVIITYTIASEDATVSVTPTNVTIFDNYPGIEKPYQLGRSVGKFENSLSGTQEYDLAVLPAYDSSKDVYMAIAINTGDDTGKQFIQTVNFGSSEFLLGNDANKWCNV